MFNVASSQFSIHYYFESEIKLRSFLQNVNDVLKMDGYFIGTAPDGEKIVEVLKGKKLIEGKMEDETIWRIEKDYK